MYVGKLARGRDDDDDDDNDATLYLPNLHRPGGTRWRSWLRYCATSRTVTGSIPDGVTGIFH